MVGEEMDGRFLTQEVVNPLRTGSFFFLKSNRGYKSKDVELNYEI